MKNWIFIEAEKAETPEYQFLKTILDKFFPEKKYDLIPMGGVDKLFSDAILIQLRSHTDEGDNCICLLDADTQEKKWGFEKRKSDIFEKQKRHSVAFMLFLYPDNSSDGDVEELMESLARRDLHSVIFDCFEDYEKCVKGCKNNLGESRYNTPNRKGKLHTYITSMKLCKQKKDKLGTGNWLFDDEDFWDLHRPQLEPLLDFFRQNLK